jgi:UDP-N-acetylglucosamine 4,6-dehydratase
MRIFLRGIVVCFFVAINYALGASVEESNRLLLENKTLLVFGGTGYLGRAIVEEALKYSPKKVIIFSRDEVKHFNVQNLFKDSRINCVIGDIRDYESVLRVSRGVDIAFHVAALKRMDALEYNAEEAIKTNIVGSMNVFNACVVNGVKKVLFVSTDKACLPVNIYGASKFAAEKVFTNYDRTKIATQCVAVRFGNILESTGSVIPIFLEKIKKGETLTLTDERMTRFIVDKKLAVELMFDALRYSVGGEIFIRRLPAMNIADLIQVLKTGLKADIPVKVTGIRPGEKLHEVLINSPEMARAVEYNGYFVIRPSVARSDDVCDAQADYMLHGKPVVGVFAESEYSSDLAVIPNDTLSKYFRELGIL